MIGALTVPVDGTVCAPIVSSAIVAAGPVDGEARGSDGTGEFEGAELLAPGTVGAVVGAGTKGLPVMRWNFMDDPGIVADTGPVAASAAASQADPSATFEASGTYRLTWMTCPTDGAADPAEDGVGPAGLVVTAPVD